MEFPFDPLQRAEAIENMVTNDILRKYYRFRPASYYGGIATADCLGCCFLCAYCWNYGRNLKPGDSGKFYTPQEVCSKLSKIIQKRGFGYVRVTGAEPILGENSFKHFLKIVELLLESFPQMTFILETNGLLLGYRKDFVQRLKPCNLSIRIAIKGWDEDSFQRITGARGNFFSYPLQALSWLIQKGYDAWPAVMEDFFGKIEIGKLRQTMKRMGIDVKIETEVLERYPPVLENLVKRGVGDLDKKVGVNYGRPLYKPN